MFCDGRWNIVCNSKILLVYCFFLEHEAFKILEDMLNIYYTNNTPGSRCLKKLDEALSSGCSNVFQVKKTYLVNWLSRRRE
jgi:hypothetical protein